MISYVIQGLSAESAFGSKLNSPLKMTLPQKWNNVGTAGDFMIQVWVLCLEHRHSLNISIGDLFDGGDHVRHVDFIISCAHYRAVQLSSVSQASQFNIINSIAPAIQCLFKSSVLTL